MPVLATHNDVASLKEMFSKTVDALEQLDELIGAHTAHINELTGNRQALEKNVQVGAAQIAALGDDAKELETRIQQANLTHSFAGDGPLAASTEAEVQRLEAERTALHQRIETARNQYIQLSASTDETCKSISQEIDQADAELLMLQERRTQTANARNEAYSMLKTELRSMVERTMKDFHEHEEIIEDELIAAQGERIDYQKNLANLLEDTPDLAAELDPRYGYHPRPPATVDQLIIKPLLDVCSFLDKIGELNGVHDTPSRMISPVKGMELLAQVLSPQLISSLLSTARDRRSYTVAARAEPLRQWLKDHEAEIGSGRYHNQLKGK